LYAACVHRKDNPSGPGALFGFDDIIAFLTSIQVNGFQIIGGFWVISSSCSIVGGSGNNAVRTVLHLSSNNTDGRVLFWFNIGGVFSEYRLILVYFKALYTSFPLQFSRNVIQLSVFAIRRLDNIYFYYV
jgi:hypothetical protein